MSLSNVVERETLAVLPSLLALARQVVVTACDPRDPEIVQLKAMLEECVVGAHRVCLREQIKAAETVGTGAT
jgi:hypothetical protein